MVFVLALLLLLLYGCYVQNIYSPCGFYVVFIVVVVAVIVRLTRVIHFGSSK